AQAQQDSRGRLRRMRNPRRHAGSDRPRDLNRGRPRRRSAQALDGDRRQMSGAPDAHLGNPDRDEGGGLADGPRAFMVRDAASRLLTMRVSEPIWISNLILRSIAK